MGVREERRQLLKGLAAVAASVTTARWAAARPPKPSTPSRPHPRATVARVRRTGIIDAAKGTVNASRLDEVLGLAVGQACGAPTPVEAFRRLFRANDVVGIKVGTLAGRGLSPHPELVAKLADWLQAAGVPANQIVIWDRTDAELASAGFTLNRSRSGVRCFGTNQDYDWTLREWGAGGSCFAKLLVHDLTALINVGVLKDHDLAGISAGLKNWYGVIHNPNKLHGNGCDPYVAHLAAYPLIRKKLRLTLIDGLVAQCQGGPARSPRWAWPWGGVLASTDPVAIDAVAWQEIEKRRRAVGLKSLTQEQREPKWIASAKRLRLGENQISRIQVMDA